MEGRDNIQINKTQHDRRNEETVTVHQFTVPNSGLNCVTISLHILNNLTVQVYYIQMNYITLFCYGWAVTIATLYLEGLWLKHFTKIISWLGFSQFLPDFHITSNTPIKSLSYHWHHTVYEKIMNESTLFLYTKPVTLITHSRRDHNSTTRCHHRWSHNCIALICAI